MIGLLDETASTPQIRCLAKSMVGSTTKKRKNLAERFNRGDGRRLVAVTHAANPFDKLGFERMAPLTPVWLGLSQLNSECERICLVRTGFNAAAVTAVLSDES